MRSISRDSAHLAGGATSSEDAKTDFSLRADPASSDVSIDQHLYPAEPLQAHSSPIDRFRNFFIIINMPKIVDHQERRRALARAAVNAVGASGLDQAKLSDIARAAGVTTGALAHYFPDKDAVLAAALEDVCRRLLSRIGADAGHVRIKDIATALPLDQVSMNDWRVWIAYWGRAPFSESLRTIHQQCYQEIEDVLTAGLAKASETPRLLAAAIIAAVDGVGTRATLDPETWPPERQRALLSALLDPLFAGLKFQPA
jgi:TetR/AcrR family transcriptional repressor of bet genes